MMLSNLETIIPLAFAFALVNAIGFARIANVLIYLYDVVFGGAAYKEYKATWKQLSDLKREIATVSAQDQFAKWARLQRQVDKAQADWERINTERSRNQMASKMKCSLVVRVAYTAGLGYYWWCGFRQSNVSVKVPIIVRLVDGKQLSIFGRELVMQDGKVAGLLLFNVIMQGIKKVLSVIIE